MTSERMSRSMCRNVVAWERVGPLFTDAETGSNGQIYTVMWSISEWTVTGNLKEFDRAAKLPDIHVPTLFTCGRYDATTPEPTTVYHRLMPGSEMVIFEHSAHMAHLDEKEIFMQTVRDFLHRVEGQIEA